MNDKPRKASKPWDNPNWDVWDDLAFLGWRVSKVAESMRRRAILRAMIAPHEVIEWADRLESPENGSDPWATLDHERELLIRIKDALLRGDDTVITALNDYELWKGNNRP